MAKVLTAAQTLLSAVAATGASVAVRPHLSDADRIVFQVTGITTATVTIQASLDGTNWFSTGTALTADGLASDANSYPYYRANVTAYTSGTITVKVMW